MAAARRHALDYLQAQNEPAYRERVYTELLREIDVIKELPDEQRARIRAEEDLMSLLARVREEHDGSTS